MTNFKMVSKGTPKPCLRGTEKEYHGAESQISGFKFSFDPLMSVDMTINALLTVL